MKIILLALKCTAAKSGEVELNERSELSSVLLELFCKLYICNMVNKEHIIVEDIPRTLHMQ